MSIQACSSDNRSSGEVARITFWSPSRSSASESSHAARRNSRLARHPRSYVLPAGIYGVAAQHGVRALAIVMASDHLLTEEALSSDERQTAVDQIVDLALETVVAL